MSKAYTTPTGEATGADLPQRINVMKLVSYTVEDLVGLIIHDRESSVSIDSQGNKSGEPATYEVTLDDVLELVEQYAKDDFGCGWGHEAHVKELIFQDENGSDLY